MKEKIGFVGLGLMGSPMAARLLNAGYQLFIYNRTKEKAGHFLSQGAIWCDSPAVVASETEIVISMVSTPIVLEEIALGNNGILSAIQKGKIHIDCSTVSPRTTKRLIDEYNVRGCSFLHAPVLGGVSQASEGALLFFVGGHEAAFKRVEPVLKNLGLKIWHFEHVEQATTTKLLCNSFISGMVVVLAQALVLAKKSDINPRTLLEIISNSQLNAHMYQRKGASIIERNFSPRFFTEHLLKDTNLILDVAESIGVPFPIGTIAKDLLTQAMDSGFAKEDYSSVIKVLEASAGIEVRQ